MTTAALSERAWVSVPVSTSAFWVVESAKVISNECTTEIHKTLDSRYSYSYCQATSVCYWQTFETKLFFETKLTHSFSLCRLLNLYQLQNSLKLYCIVSIWNIDEVKALAMCDGIIHNFWKLSDNFIFQKLYRIISKKYR